MINISGFVGFVVTLFILSILVLIHEFGHFIVGKKLGIKVEEFGFGFPPKAWGKKIGETLYTINWLPIGGFVKLYGEDEAGGGKLEVKDPTEKVTDIDRAFFARPVWQRAFVVVAGVIMNALLAFLIYYVFMFLSGFHTELQLIGDHKFFAVNQENRINMIVTDVSKNSPAEKAGLKKCSTNYCAAVIAINGKKPQTSDEFIQMIKKNEGKNTQLTVENEAGSKGKFIVNIIPRVHPPKNEGALGIAFFPAATVALTYSTPTQKFFSGIIHPINLMLYNFDVMRYLIIQSIKDHNATQLSNGLSGPVGIVKIGAEINQITDMKERILQFLNLAGLLSISLAAFNVLPIPALDGGRLFFILVEGVVGKKVSPKVEATIHTVGMVVLMALILLVTFKDVFQLFH